MPSMVDDDDDDTLSQGSAGREDVFADSAAEGHALAGENAADGDGANTSLNPLHRAIVRGDAAAVERLTSLPGADVNARTAQQETPLLLAAAHLPAAVPLLLDRGARVDARGPCGLTALGRVQAALAREPQGASADLQRALSALQESEAAFTAGPVREASERLREAGNRMFSLENFERASEMYTDALALVPDDYRCLSNRAACALRLAAAAERRGGGADDAASASAAHWERALADAERAARLCPAMAKAHYRRARALLGLREFSLALRALTEGLESCPGERELIALKDRLEALGVPPAAPEAARASAAGAEQQEGPAGGGESPPSAPCGFCGRLLSLPLAQFGGRCPLCGCDPAAEIAQGELDALRLGR